MRDRREAPADTRTRFLLVSVPGRAADGSDAAWFVFDRQSRRSAACVDRAAGVEYAAGN